MLLTYEHDSDSLLSPATSSAPTHEANQSAAAPPSSLDSDQLPSSTPPQGPPELPLVDQDFANNHLDMTLYHLTAYLLGSRIKRLPLDDEALDRLVQYKKDKCAIYE